MLRELRRFGAAALLVAAFAAPCFAQSGDRGKFIISDDVQSGSILAPNGRKIAIVIAVSDLSKSELQDKSLPFVENDARRMIATLYRDGFDVWPLCEESVPLPKLDPDRKRPLRKVKAPTKKNIEETVAQVLKGLGENDVLLLYFSGHGLEEENQTYLVAKDSSAKNVAATCVSLAEMRNMVAAREEELQKDQARVEPRCILAIDSCHSGGGTRSAKGFDDLVHFQEIKNQATAGVATFASCALNQKSYGWTPCVLDPLDVAEEGENHDVSLFTFWLNAGLKGFADGSVDGQADGKIDSKELFKYIDDNVELHRDQEQTTCVIARRDEKRFVLCDVPTMKYDEALTAVAKQIVTKAKLLNKRNVDLSVKAGECNSAAKNVDDLVSFARYASANLQDNVDDLMREVGGQGGNDGAKGSVEVNATVELAEREIVDDQGNAQTVVEYVVACRFDEESFVKAGRESDVGAFEVTARILPKNAGETQCREQEPADAKPIGDAAPVPPAPVTPAPVTPAPVPPAPVADFVLPNVEIQATLDGENWTTRPIYRAADGANWVELNPGETYRVVVQPSNHASNPKTVGLRLLIDGRNTLPQAEMALYAGSRSAVAQPLVRLDEARWWALQLAKGGVYDAFYGALDQVSDKIRAEGKLLQVASADPIGSEATGQNGLIHFAFYALKDRESARTASDVRTIDGGDTQNVFEAHIGQVIDYPLASFRLRYASAARLAELGVAESELVGAETSDAEAEAEEDYSDYVGTRGSNRSRKTSGGVDKSLEPKKSKTDSASSSGVWR